MYKEKIVENFWVTSVSERFMILRFVSDAVFLSIYWSTFDETWLSLVL